MPALLQARDSLPILWLLEVLAALSSKRSLRGQVASAVLATVGGTALTVSGIGLILLGAGVALQVGAVVLTPTPLQRWLSRSHFGRDPSIFDWDGKRDDMFVKGDWKAEFAAFQEALAVAGKEAPPKPSLVDKVKAVVSP